MTITERDLQSIIQLFDESDWEEFNFRSDELEIHVSKSRSIGRLSSSSPDVEASPSVVATGARRSIAVSSPQIRNESTSRASDEPVPDGLEVVRAPNLGVFYRSPKPGAPPYVEVGQIVDANSEICLIEVMKLFTPVKAGVRGTVRKILVEDGALVEFDQALLLIEPSD